MESDGEVKLGVFILRMSSSSESEGELEKDGENGMANESGKLVESEKSEKDVENVYGKCSMGSDAGADLGISLRTRRAKHRVNGFDTSRSYHHCTEYDSTTPKEWGGGVNLNKNSLVIETATEEDDEACMKNGGGKEEQEVNPSSEFSAVKFLTKNDESSEISPSRVDSPDANTLLLQVSPEWKPDKLTCEESEISLPTPVSQRRKSARLSSRNSIRFAVEASGNGPSTQGSRIRKSLLEASRDKIVGAAALPNSNSSLKPCSWSPQEEIDFATSVIEAMKCGLCEAKPASIDELKRKPEFWEEVHRLVQGKTRKELTIRQVYNKFSRLKSKILFMYRKLSARHKVRMSDHEVDLFEKFLVIMGKNRLSLDISQNLSITSKKIVCKSTDSTDLQQLSIQINGSKCLNSGARPWEKAHLDFGNSAVSQDGRSCIPESSQQQASADSGSMRMQIQGLKEFEPCPTSKHETIPTILPSASPDDPSSCRGCQRETTRNSEICNDQSKLVASNDDVTENLDALHGEKHTRDNRLKLEHEADPQSNKNRQDCEQKAQYMQSKMESKYDEWKRYGFVTDTSLVISRILEEGSCGEGNYIEFVKFLERRSRKLQLMQELYRIEQEELDDSIRLAKLKASLAN